MDDLTEGLNQAIEAAGKALVALVLVLAILVARTFQAIFFLARPAALLGCVVAAGYASVTLFGTVLVRYGGDLPAVFLALSAVVLVPAALLVLAGDYGVWAVMLAVAILDFMAHLGIERAPPMVLSLLPILALMGTVSYFLAHMNDVPESNQESKKGDDDEQERNECSTVDCDDEPDHLHGHPEL